MKRRLDLWRVPSVLQLEDTECGAAALAMILAGFGRWVSLAEVRTACGISRDGSKAKNLVRAARSYGLEVAAARYNSAEPLRSLTMPAIVLVNLNHFLVLEGFERSGVSLNDPAEGRRRVTTVEFERMFSGIALTFAPGPGFKTGGCRPSTLALALDWLRGDRDALALMMLIGLMQILLGLLVPGFIRTFVDYGLYARQDVLIAYMLPIMVAAALLQGTLVWWRGFLLVRLQTRIMLSACGRFVHRMLRLPILFFARRYPGSISNRTELAPDLAAHVAGILGGLMADGVTVIAFAALMLAWHPVLAAIALGTGAATILITAALHASLGGCGRQLALLRSRLAAVTARSLSMLEDVKTSGTEDVVFSRWIGQLTLLGNREQEQGRLTGRLGALSDGLAMMAMVAVLIVGCALVMKGEITLGTLMGFQALHIGFCAAIAGLIERGRQLTGARSVFEQFADVLANPTAPEFAEPEAAVSGPAGKPPMRLSGRVSVRGLSFGYVETEPALLEAFSLDLKPGARVALVGESGSGKSTIGRLVNGLLLPWAGDILFDGRPLAGLPRALLRNSLAVVDQDIVLFDGSIRDNLTLWDRTMPENLMIQAARDAEIHDDIVARPGGYDAPVGENGRYFSGGQRQRLEIARALACAPSILVLDEATSALDPSTERRVMANLHRRGCTCLVIAHRLSTIRDCDEIIVLGRGAVLERGSHEVLAARDGPYRRLVET